MNKNVTAQVQAMFEGTHFCGNPDLVDPKDESVCKQNIDEFIPHGIRSLAYGFLLYNEDMCKTVYALCWETFIHM